MTELERLTKEIVEFVNERDWTQFHNPKDLALSLALEAAEVLEHFQWKTEKEIADYVVHSKDEVAEELSDVLYWVLLMSYYLNIDVVKSSFNKLEQNRNKYPVEKARGKHTKYNKL